MHTNTGARQFRFASEIEYGEVDEKRSHVPPPSRSERIAGKKYLFTVVWIFFSSDSLRKFLPKGRLRIPRVMPELANEGNDRKNSLPNTREHHLRAFFFFLARH